MDWRVYLDASALAKRYVPEVGAPLVDHLFAHSPPLELCCLLLNALEVVSMFVRKHNSHRISTAVYAVALSEYQRETLNGASFRKLTATDACLNAAVPLILRHSINATDAVLLHSALDLATEVRGEGGNVLLVSADRRLIRAARAEGLLTFDPETQTQTDLDALLAP